MTPSPTPTPTPVGQTPSPTPTPAPPILGDANCDGTVDSDDVFVLLAKIAGVLLGECAQASGVAASREDTNCDGDLTALDALHVLLHLAGLPELPKPTGCAEVGAPLTA